MYEYVRYPGINRILNIEPVRVLQSNQSYFATPYQGYFATPSKWPPEPRFRPDIKTDLATGLTDP